MDNIVMPCFLTHGVVLFVYSVFSMRFQGRKYINFGGGAVLYNVLIEPSGSLSNFISSLSDRKRRENKIKLECGPMPNVMVALPNIGGALGSTLQFG